MNEHDVIELVKNKIKDRENTLLNKIAEKVVYWFLKGEKYDIDYSQNVPYDCSGEIYMVSEKFDKNDYSSLGDFLDEYTGNREATYCSGCGWGYPTYGDELDYFLTELLCEIYEECFNFLLAENPSVITAITGFDCMNTDNEFLFSCFYDLMGSEIFTSYYIDQWRNIAFEDIFNRGEFVAKRKLNEELKLAEYRQSKDAEYIAAAEDLFNRYVNLCGEKIELITASNSKYSGRHFRQTKDVFIYLDKVIYNEIKDILNTNFTQKELAILSKYKLITTNSVTCILEGNVDLYM